MSETCAHSVTLIYTWFRGFFIFIDHAFFGLLELVYQLFFNVASSDIVSSTAISKFFGRMQLIIGVFMMFQLALIILRGIVNPESFTDKKSGAGNLVTRVVTALVLLTLLVPITVPKPASSMNEYEMQINNNGLLFGTLYSLQHRLLANDTIGKIVLGTNRTSNSNFSSDDDLKNGAKLFTAAIVRSFYRINLIPYEDRLEHAEDGDDAEIASNRMCDDMGPNLDIYIDENTSASMILDIANETCSQNKIYNILGDVGSTVSALAGEETYMFTTMPFISSAAAIVFIFIFISFTVDVAIRAIKLAVLRLIAPIPIISYMDPKGSKDGAFNAWVKSLTSTYLDLFVRLAVIYFVLFLVQDMIVNHISVAGSGGLRFLSRVVIWIGLLLFAKEAPKFIRQVLGIKDDGSGRGIFSGLGSILAVGAAAGGIAGSIASNVRASREENAALHPNQRLLNFGKNIASGIGGAIGGGFVGAKALMGKDATVKSVMQAQNERNATRLSHSTATGRFADSMYGMFTGKSLADKLSDTGTAGKDAFSALKSWKESVKAEAIKNGGKFDYELSNGKWLRGITYDQIDGIKKAGTATDATTGEQYYVINGEKVNAGLLGGVVMDRIADEQVKAWQSGKVDAKGKTYVSVTTGTGKLAADHERTIKAVNDAEITVNGHSGSALVDSYEDLGNAMGEANRMHQRSETNMQQRMRIANKQNKK